MSAVERVRAFLSAWDEVNGGTANATRIQGITDFSDVPHILTFGDLRELLAGYVGAEHMVAIRMALGSVIEDSRIWADGDDLLEVRAALAALPKEQACD